MIDEQGYPKIVDFGVADFEHEIVNGSHFGTLSYMAPEMILGEKYSYTADYYSLGVLMLLILTGDMFAVGKTVAEAQKHVLKRRKTLTFKKLKKRYNFLSNECIDFLFKLLQGRPKDRIGNEAGISEIKTHHWLVNIPWNEFINKSFKSPIMHFVDYYKNKQSLGEQHFLGVRKRDEGLKEKEDKAIDIVKNSINDENDPKNELYDNFGEFSRMNVTLIEEEIMYENMDDYEGSTYPEHNLIDKQQSTPSVGTKESQFTSQDQDKESAKSKNNENQNPEIESDVNAGFSMSRKYAKAEVGQSDMASLQQQKQHEEGDGGGQVEDSIALMQQIIEEGTEIIKRDSAPKSKILGTKNSNLSKSIKSRKGAKTAMAKSKPIVSTKGKNASKPVKNYDFGENEIPLLSKDECDELESVQDHYDYNDCESGTFVLTPTKK